MWGRSVGKSIEICRLGKFTSTQGVEVDFTEDMVAASIAAYNPAVHEAPLVIGHPKHNAPAFGWVQSLAQTGQTVAADCDQVNPDFAEMVRAGSFKKISASWYTPDNPANPVPGVHYLRHVGFLGAQPPAIKGLKAVEFAEDEAGVVTVEFGEADTRIVSRLFRTLRDFLLSEFGQDKADMALPGWDVNWLADQVAEDAARAAETPAFAEATPSKEPVLTEPTTPKTDDALKKQQAALDKREADFAERERAFRRQKNEAALDALVAQGKPLPVNKAALLDFMDALDPAAVLDFGENDKRSPLDFFMSDVLSNLKVQVDFSERAPGDGGDQESDPATTAAAARDFQEAQAKAGIVVSATEAVAHVLKETRK